MMVEDAVLAPTKRIAERKKAIPAASFEKMSFAFIIAVPSFGLYYTPHTQKNLAQFTKWSKIDTKWSFQAKTLIFFS